MVDDALRQLDQHRAEEQVSRLLWSPALINCAALIAACSFIGASKSPDATFAQLYLPLVLVVAGLTVSAVGFVIEHRYRGALISLDNAVVGVRRAVEAGERVRQRVDNFAPARDALVIALGGDEAADNEIRGQWSNLLIAREREHDLLLQASDRLKKRSKDTPKIWRLRRLMWAMIFLSYLLFGLAVGGLGVAHALGAIRLSGS